MYPLKLIDFNSLIPQQLEPLPGGYVKLPWQPIYQETQILPNKFILRDGDDNYVPAQVFEVDPLDPCHNFLLISLTETLAKCENLSAALGSLRMEKNELVIPNREFPRLEIIWGPNKGVRGVKLLSGQLSVWFNLIPAPGDDENNWNWYSGSATSVLRGDQEMLEPFKSHDWGTVQEPHWMGHDPQQRCMQVDKIQIWDKARNAWSEPYKLSYQSYELITYNIGSLGVSITIASTPFNYNEEDEESKCRLYRVISLLKDTDYLLEDLFVSRVNPRAEKREKGDYLEFKAHYFTFMNLFYKPDPQEDTESHQAFIMSSIWSSQRESGRLLYPAYGFRSNVPLEKLDEDANKIVEYPTKDFPQWPNYYRTFSWGLSRCQLGQCLHRFAFRERQLDFSSMLLLDFIPEINSFQTLLQ
jgi:hypothetical protein